MKRIASLDYLRGLMALSVMLYHLISVEGVDLGASSVLARMGLYAVAVFYILSGISLTLAYQHKLASWGSIGRYAIKRVGRILPLLWLATSLVLLRDVLMAHALHQSVAWPSAQVVFLNYSLLFGFVKPGAYLVTGGWSIGNELVFYLVFPMMMVLYRVWQGVCRVLFPVLLVGVCGYSVEHLDAARSLTHQWLSYIEPANQFYLFFAGVVVALFCAPASVNFARRHMGALLVLLAAFVFYPLEGDRVLLVAGSGRLVLSLICVLLCLGVYRVRCPVPLWLHVPLNFLGEASYSVYLLHPIVAGACWVVLSHCHVSRVMANVVVAMPLTLLLAYLSYHYLERPGVRIAAQLASSRSDAGPVVSEAGS